MKARAWTMLLLAGATACAAAPVPRTASVSEPVLPSPAPSVMRAVPLPPLIPPEWAPRPYVVSVNPIAAAALLSAALEAEGSMPGPVHWPSLDEVAAAAASSAAREGVVSEGEMRAAMVSSLRSSATPHVVTAWLVAGSESLEDPATVGTWPLASTFLPPLFSQLSVAVRELASEVRLEGYGIAVRRGDAGVVAVVVGVPPPRLPLRVDRRGARAVVTAHWQHESEPVAFLVTPQHSRRLAWQRQGEDLRIEVPCGAGPRDLELTSGRLFASVVDVCRPNAPRWGFGGGDLGPVARTLVETEQRSFELLNRERRQHGLAPIAWEGRAHEVARAHSRDQAQHQRVSHFSSDGGTLDLRLARGDLPVWRAFENVGRGGPAELHLGFLTSEGHRRNLLAPQAKAGAVGAALSESGEVFLTQVLFEPVPLRKLGR